MAEPIRFSGPEYEAQYFPASGGAADGSQGRFRAGFESGEFHVYDLAGRHAWGRVAFLEGEPFFHLEGCDPGFDLGLAPKATAQIQASFRAPLRLIRTGHE